ncbi:unnamed protein product [Arabidopsis halleri]
MGTFKANFQIFENCLKIHGESLVPTVFRRLLRPIRVGFLPLEKTPGGFRFQVKFKIRFPKPPWNLFYINTLIFTVFSCLNQVTKMSDNLWHRLQNITLGFIFFSSVLRDLVGQFWGYSLIGQTNSLTHGDPNSDRGRYMLSGNIFWYRQRHFWRRISQFVHSDWRTIQTQIRGLLFPVVLKFNFEIGKIMFNQSGLLRLLVLDNADSEELVKMGVIIDLIVTLGFIWRIISWRFDMFGIFSSGFQTQRNKKSWDLLTVRQVPRGLRERFICGDLHQSTGFKALKICLLNGQMRILESSIVTKKETMVINEQRCIRRFKTHGQEPFQTTYHNFLSIKVMRKAFRSFIYMMIACYECMKRGLNRFFLLPVRLLLESRVTSTSSSKLGFNFLYLFQWLYLNGFMYHVSCIM